MALNEYDDILIWVINENEGNVYNFNNGVDATNHVRDLLDENKVSPSDVIVIKGHRLRIQVKEVNIENNDIINVKSSVKKRAIKKRR